MADKAFWARCSCCNCSFAAASYPREVMVMVRALRRAKCPSCGAKGKSLTMAKQNDGVLMDLAHSKHLLGDQGILHQTVHCLMHGHPRRKPTIEMLRYFEGIVPGYLKK